MSKMYKGYLIDPDKREVTEVETDGSLRDIYRLLSRPGVKPVECIDVITISDSGDVVWVDDNGMITPDIPVFRLSCRTDHIAGRGLVLGVDDGGNDIGASDDIGRTLRDGGVIWTDKVSTGQLGPTVEVKPGHIRIGDPILKDAPV